MAIEKRAFCLFATCSVEYDGRATSTLDLGNYLIVYKNDGSVSIHGSTMVLPRNYMGSNSQLFVCGDVLIFTRKKESIKITISEIITIAYLNDWSDNKIRICRTEKELATKIFDNWSDYFDDDFELIYTEYPTELGPVDLFGLTLTTDYVVEVKRKRASLKDVSQLKRYLEAVAVEGRLSKGFIAAPSISPKAEKYLKKHDLYFLEVDFD
jgi:RecB family endonuclease NucS